MPWAARRLFRKAAALQPWANFDVALSLNHRQTGAAELTLCHKEWNSSLAVTEHQLELHRTLLKSGYTKQITFLLEGHILVKIHVITTSCWAKAMPPLEKERQPHIPLQHYPFICLCRTWRKWIHLLSLIFLTLKRWGSARVGAHRWCAVSITA